MARNISNLQPTSASARYPTLFAIDQARGSNAVAFATDPNAASLERAARALTDEYWSETTWRSGLVSDTQMAAVCTRLEDEREALLDSVRVIVAGETTSRIPSSPSPRK